MKNKNIIMSGMTTFLLASALTVGLVGCSQKEEVSTPSNTTTSTVQTSNVACQTPAGQTFKSENAALIRQIAQADASMGNDGFTCQ